MDFSGLLPREKLAPGRDEGQMMELVNRDGHTFFAPVGDRDLTGITSFSKWEQAYRIFSNIYTRAYPERASELIQYNPGFPLGLEKLENLEKWEGIFQSGKSQGILNRLEKSGKSQGKPHKIMEN